MTITCNKLWYAVDYSEYDVPTIIRRQGFSILRKFWSLREPGDRQ
jgi:hypothetical protein